MNTDVWFCLCGAEAPDRFRTCDACVTKRRERRTWAICGSCDYGLPMNCTCPA
jgi:hypothetical protein